MDSPFRYYRIGQYSIQKNIYTHSEYNIYVNDVCIYCAWLSRLQLSPSSVSKPSNCNNLRILLVYSRHTDACPEVIYVRPTVNTVFINKHCCSSVLMLRPRRLEQSSLIWYALLTVSFVLGLSSRLTCSQEICSRSTVRASDTLTRSFIPFVTYLHKWMLP